MRSIVIVLLLMRAASGQPASQDTPASQDMPPPVPTPDDAAKAYEAGTERAGSEDAAADPVSASSSPPPSLTPVQPGDQPREITARGYFNTGFLISYGEKYNGNPAPPSHWIFGRIAAGVEIRQCAWFWRIGGTLAVAGEGYGADFPGGLGLEGALGYTLASKLRLGGRVGLELFDKGDLATAGVRVQLYRYVYVGVDVFHSFGSADVPTSAMAGIGFEGRIGAIAAGIGTLTTAIVAASTIP